MLEDMYTIQGMNGEVKQGALEWIDHECFWFFDGVKMFWGKIDFWTILTKGVRIVKI